MLVLPDEVLHEIVLHLTDSNVRLSVPHNDPVFSRHRRPNDSFAPNSSRINHGYSDLISLSSTCTRFRKLLAKSLFYSVSLVRRSEIDAIMAYPTRLDKWSHTLNEYRELVETVLEANFALCERETQDLQFLSVKSRYQRELSLNHFVSTLEITNNVLRSDTLSLFPSIVSLKVLDMPASIECGITAEFLGQSITQLSVNLETLLGCDSLMALVPQLHKLTTICDIHSLEPGKSLPNLERALGSGHNLRHLDVFVSDPNLLQYMEFMDLFKHILSHGPIETLQLRLTKKVGLQAAPKPWSVFPRVDDSGPAFVGALASSKLVSSVAIDLGLANNLAFPANYRIPTREAPPQCVSFYLIDYSLSVPELLSHPREVVATLLLALGVTDLIFIYGEVIDQAQILAISVITNLLMYMLNHQKHTCRVQAVSVEKAWSMSDDSLVRHYYETLMDSYDAALPGSSAKKHLLLRIARVSSTAYHHFSSPRYRRREEYAVETHSCSSMQTATLVPLEKSPHRPDHFWPAECLGRDLDHYCMRERALSSIWQ